MGYELKTRWMMMKRMVLAGLLVAGAMVVPAQAQTRTVVGDPQAKDDLFAGTEKFAKNASDVTEVTMDPQSLGMVEGKDKGKAHGMRLSVVRTYSYDKPGQYDMAEVDAFRNKLMTGEWHCSVHVRSLKTGESTDVCNKNRSDDMVESAIITVEPKSLTFIHTIKQKSQGGSDYDQQGTLGVWPLTMGPEMQARMAVMGAEMQARMAAMQPELMAAMAHEFDGNDLKTQMDGLENMKVPRMEELQRQVDRARRDAERPGHPSQPE
jgi:hypothetical protein